MGVSINIVFKNLKASLEGDALKHKVGENLSYD